MDTGGDWRPRFRVLGPNDRAAATAIATAAFGGNRFYEESMDLDRDHLAAYWDPFLALALGDRSARVLGAEVEGRLLAIAVLSYHGFPARQGALRFIVRLGLSIGLRRTWGYLRFVRAYDRAMRRSAEDEGREARGLWLMAQPGATHPRIGGALARFAAERARLDGKEICTGFVDAGNEPLLAFYRRLRYRIGPRFPFAGRWAVVVERASG